MENTCFPWAGNCRIQAQDSQAGRRLLGFARFIVKCGKAGLGTAYLTISLKQEIHARGPRYLTVYPCFAFIPGEVGACAGFHVIHCDFGVDDEIYFAGSTVALRTGRVQLTD